MPRSERNLYLWFIGIGFAHLMVGLFLGFMQGMQHAGIDLYRVIPIVRHYYQGLTAHGVFNVLVFTTFFIAGFLLFVTGTSLRKPMSPASRLDHVLGDDHRSGHGRLTHFLEHVVGAVHGVLAAAGALDVLPGAGP